MLSSSASLCFLMHAAPPPLRTFGWQMSMTVEEAATIWGLQRNRQTGRAQVLPNVFGWDTEEVVTRVERRNGPSLGIVLEEIGSAEDIGLVLVDSCVDGGNAAAASLPLLPGDLMVAVANAGGPALCVEALPYDATIAALGSLDPSQPVELTLRRLVKLPRCAVTLKFAASENRADEQFELLGGMPLRRSILSKGIKLNDPLARRFDAGWGTGDCGGEGTCCTCAVDVIEGTEVLNGQGSQERQMLSKHPSWRLACKASIVNIEQDTRLVLKVAPRQEVDETERDSAFNERA